MLDLSVLKVILLRKADLVYFQVGIIINQSILKIMLELSLMRCTTDSLVNIPKTHEETITSVNSTCWQNTTEDKMNTLRENSRYELVCLPESRMVWSNLTKMVRNNTSYVLFQRDIHKYLALIIMRHLIYSRCYIYPGVNIVELFTRWMLKML